MAQDRVEAVERALTLLDAFSEDEIELSLADLAEKTGFYKSTILRLSRSLERFGYLTRRLNGGFRLGPALWRLGSLYRRDFDLGEHLRPVLRRLRDECGESASFYVRDGDVRVCLYRINARREIRHHLEEGAQLPLRQGAAGKLLLAYDGEPGDEFDTIRTHGHAVSLGERDAEIAALAVPVRRSDGSLVGALSLSGLATHFDDEMRARGIALLKREATALAADVPVF